MGRSQQNIHIIKAVNRFRGFFLVLLAAVLLSWYICLPSYAIDPPHNSDSGIDCNECHGETIFLASPDSLTPEELVDSYNNMCLRCHKYNTGTYDANTGPYIRNHDKIETKSDRVWPGGKPMCIDCHHPHFQSDQLLKGRLSYPADLFIATGTASNSNVISDTSDPARPRTTITYNSLTVKPNSDWDTSGPPDNDPGVGVNKLGNKSNDGRGAIFLRSRNSHNYSHIIESIDFATKTIVVKGAFDSVSSRYGFAIAYGQSVKSNITYPSASGMEVEFADLKGVRSFAHNDNPGGNDTTPYGICQVCHTQTNHWSTSSPPDDDHYSGQNCIVCHQHSRGFAHKIDGTGAICGTCHDSNKHAHHLGANVYCSNCHDLANMRDGGGVIIPPDMSAGGLCSTCHHDGTGGNANVGFGGFAAGWASGTDYNLNCAGCHDGRPHTDINDDVYVHDPASTCTDCHKGHVEACHADPADHVADCDGDVNLSPCSSCHDGTGVTTGLPAVQDLQRLPIGMQTQGHKRLVSTKWIRQYDCYFCHADTVDEAWNMSEAHVNSSVDVAMAEKWEIVSQPKPSYNNATKICYNTYCHSDGTYVTPEMRPYEWDGGHRDCNACHGHNPADNECSDCHSDGRVWSAEEKWLSAMPMYENTGPGTDRANTHFRHLFTGFSCDDCHETTVVGPCLDCHDTGVPAGAMSEEEHINPVVHVDKNKTVEFKDGGTYDSASKSCSSTVCHTGSDPYWGGSVSQSITCLECHGTTEADVDDFGEFNDIRAKINLTQWATTGHGRPTSEGDYSVASNNPAANLPGNGCWYCHDNQVLHKTPENPFRLRQHDQFSNRFEKECVYCHMIGNDAECLSCHDNTGSLAPQLGALVPDHSDKTTGCSNATCHDSDATRHKTGDETLWTQAEKDDIENSYMMMGVCLKCHDDDAGGQCNSCHAAPQDDPETTDIDESLKYAIGFDPGLTGTSYIKPQKAKASSFHFGYKHYIGYETDGKWRGGKFCWDCHDPHGDDNIYMIQNEVATETDGIFGKPISRAEVEFTSKISGLDYAWEDVDENGDVKGVCNVCHTNGSQHYTAAGGDGHNSGRLCTDCHEHRFTDSHSSGQPCNKCHQNKPVPRHSGMGLPRDCTKCHKGVVGQRMDIMGQFAANSHHVQGVEVTNQHCYACHWEATEDGLINTEYHEGYDYRDHSSVPNAKVDLVIWNEFEKRDNDNNLIDDKPTEGGRPTVYDPDGTNPAGPGKPTVIAFTASQLKVSNPAQRAEVSNVTVHCLGCHSDINNDSEPFDDCKTPRQYAWDRTSVAARYDTDETTPWGKEDSTAFPNVSAKDDVTKAFSAHGRAVLNQGGFSTTDGEDKNITNTRGGGFNVQCFDCHSSHGSKAIGTTSSYVTFNGTKNGGNLKETQGGVGGYNNDYTATENENMGSINPYMTGAGQCFDCHENANVDTLVGPGSYTPWGYNETFGATAPVMGFRDSKAFGQSSRGFTDLFTYKKQDIVGGHFKRSSDLSVAPMGTIDGLCTPCHDPHGISPTLGEKQQYAVPLLKGTWMTSPYKEDVTGNLNDGYGGNDYYRNRQRSTGYPKPPQQRSDGRPPGAWRTDRNTFNTTDLSQRTGGPKDYDRIDEDPDSFAGLCLRCHPKDSLTTEVGATATENLAWGEKERIHRSVKGWGWNEGNPEREHSFTCSKCHSAHVSGLPRLMKTNCLNYEHRGRQPSGGAPSTYSTNDYGRFPFGWWAKGEFERGNTAICHGADTANGSGDWPANQGWNNITPWTE